MHFPGVFIGKERCRVQSHAAFISGTRRACRRRDSSGPALGVNCITADTPSWRNTAAVSREALPPRACPVTTFVQRNEHPTATTPHKTDPALLKRQTHSTSGVPSTVYASHVGPGLPTWAPASYVLLICIPGRVWARHPVLNQCPGVSEWCNQTFQLHGSTCPFLFNTVAPGTDSPGAGEALLSF